MNIRKKIVHVQLLPIMSGVQKVSLDELAQLNPDHYERIVVCKCEGEFTDKLRKLGVTVHLIPKLERSISPLKDIFAYIALCNFFRRVKPDIVHTHSSKTGILGRFAAHSCNVSMIVHTVHGFAFPGESRRLIKAIYLVLEFIAAKYTSTLIVLNDSDARLARNILKVPINRIAHLPNGVDVKIYSPPVYAQRQMLRHSLFGVSADDHVIIGMIGRLWLQKNPQCFLRAASKVVAQRQQVSFFIIGDGEFRAELEAMIRMSGYESRISIMGWRSDIPDLLKGLDIMVLPSRWEGMPLAILEAMSTGVPVIASDIPGNHNLVQDGKDGRLFPSDDSDHLAEALVGLVDDVAMRKTLGHNARNKIMENYTLSARMRKINTLYERTL